MTMDDRKIIVPAFTMKLFTRSHVARATFFTAGT